MRRIALHEYLGQIEGLVDDNRLPEAAAHCHFVLQQYPRHIGAYRLFGRALLEQHLYEDAIDVFERLLSADPEDLISHAGLALAYGESRNLARAIWHMERAFDIDPYNRAVQDELRKLYIARDGDAPPRLALTRAALARLHLRAALYDQALAEFAQLVVANPDRVDLKLGLAETYYRAGDVVEAAAVCQKVLATLPFSIKANAMLADALLRDERIDEARIHLRRVQDLTMLDRAHLEPDTTLGQALGNTRISLPESVQVELLEDTLAFAREFEERGAWPEAATAVVVDGETPPDWLQALESPAGSAAPKDLPESEEMPEPVDMIDWLDEVAGTAGKGSTNGDADLTPEPLVSEVELFPAVEPEVQHTADEPVAVADDSLGAILNDLELADDFGVEADGVPTEAAHEALSATESEAVIESPETETPIWGDEKLLALDELKSYIDDDTESHRVGGSAPEWLNELSERSDVVDELPQWLHEAVGFEAPDSAANPLDPQRRNEPTAAASAELGHDYYGQGEPREPDGTDVAQAVDSIRPEPGKAEASSQKASASTTVPDWLLEGDEVLDELPGELLAADAAGGASQGGRAEATMAWLDELAEQLTAGDASILAEDAPSEAGQDDDADRPPAGRPAE